MKKIDKLVLSSFLGPYILSFFIAEFVLIMQFLWKYIDEILGKGFSVFHIVELIVYYAMTIIPMALPISVLIASVMVFGDMAEKYELSSMKSAGISLLRIMRPALYLSIATALFSIFASNYLKPTANFQFKKRWAYIQRQQSTLVFEEGIPNEDFRNFKIIIGKKYKDQPGVKNVLIYDQSQNDRSLLNMIKSDSAKMYTTTDGNFFVMNLVKGAQYQEGERTTDGSHRQYPFIRTNFDTYTKVFDLSVFRLDENSLNISSKKEDMLNTFQIVAALDSLDTLYTKSVVVNKYDFSGLLSNTDPPKNPVKDSIAPTIIRDTQKQPKNIEEVEKKLKAESNKLPKNEAFAKDIAMLKRQNEMRKLLERQKMEEEKAKIRGIGFKQKDVSDLSKYTMFHETLDSITYVNAISKGLSFSHLQNDQASNNAFTYDNIHKQKELLRLRLNQTYSFALVCILFLFIGAPLGSIIRKGGYGYPLLVAILFYMIFIISTIFGEKMNNKHLVSVYAAWLPCLILCPFALLFTKMALEDSKLPSINVNNLWLVKLFKKWKSGPQKALPCL